MPQGAGRWGRAATMKDSMAEEYLQSRIQQAKQEIAKIEKRVYDAETEYFSCESSQMGTVLKVSEDLLNASRGTVCRGAQQQQQPTTTKRTQRTDGRLTSFGR